MILRHMDHSEKTRHLVDRLARLDAADAWACDLNPSQAAALDYLARANRFSRLPSHVADYLASTRGTVSQTLKALSRKGLVADRRSEADRRSVRYDLTEAGTALIARRHALEAAVRALGDARVATLNDALSDVLRQVLQARGLRSFGMCSTCQHHDRRGAGGYCRLLDVDLKPAEAEQICHEHSAGGTAP